VSEPTWFKSSYSGTQQGACVETADLGTAVGVRDSTDPNGPKLALSRESFGRLLREVKADRLSFR
jgi:hypothetical protein